MIDLRVLGAVELRRDGADVRSVLSQPRRLALLVHLCVAAPDGHLPRERLLDLFWPGSDPDRARNALRQALHFLRRSLGDGVVVAGPDGAVGIAPGTVACDVVAFRRAVATGRLDEALELYRGDLLPGIHLDDAPQLERWLEDERSALARTATEAAWALVEAHEARGESAAAVVRARQAVGLAPLDESGVRRLMELLARAGDGAAALVAFSELEARLAAELGDEPEPGTREVAETIRSTVPGARVAAPGETAAPSGPVSAPAGMGAGPAAPASVPAQEPLPQGEAAAGEVDTPSRPASPPPERRPPLRRTALAGTGLALLLLALWMAAGGPGRAPAGTSAEGPASIAVLPFLDLSDRGGHEYFGDGVAEELLNVLAGVPDLRVAARTSSFAFRNAAVPIDSIARALSVTHVLEGSVRTSGTRVRITAQLIEARNGFHLWSETYDRELDDIFAVQDEIAAAIARQLQVELAGDFWGVSERETRDPEAHRRLLRALHTFRVPTPENYAVGVTLLEGAIQRDSTWARAHGALANILLWQAYLGWGPAEELVPRAQTLARRSMELGETVDGHLALARLAESRALDPDAADRHYRRALELNPSDVRALQLRALFLARDGRGDEALALARLQTELDPLHPGAWANLANVLTMLSREEEALAALEKARSVAPDDVLVLANLANQYGTVGRLDDALATLERALQLDSTRLHLLGLRAHLLFRAGRSEEALARRAELERRPEFSRMELASLYAQTQDIDRILELLEEAVARREDGVSRIRSPDMFRGLRHHPRFVALLERLESGGG